MDTIPNKKPTHYRSGLEKYAAKVFKSNSIIFEYEPWSVILLHKGIHTYNSFEKVGKSFRLNNNIRQISYKPDFVGEKWIMETKGFKRAAFSLRWKLFKQLLQDSGKEYTLFMPSTPKEVDESIKIIKEIG